MPAYHVAEQLTIVAGVHPALTITFSSWDVDVQSVISVMTGVDPPNWSTSWIMLEAGDDNPASSLWGGFSFTIADNSTDLAHTSLDGYGEVRCHSVEFGTNKHTLWRFRALLPRQ